MIRYRIRLCFCLLLISAIQGLRAQYPVRMRTIAWPADSLFIPDSLTPVMPAMRSPDDTSMRFLLDLRSNMVRIQRYTKQSDSIRLVFPVFPFPLNRPVFRFNPAAYDSLLAFADYPARRIPLGEKREEIISLPGIQKSGVISRGLSLSNGQNGFVNSSMNLQLSGMLSNDIRLTALLSDQSMPFQPQGNTSQIRELDRIFIRLEHRRADLLAGDVVLKDAGNSAFFRLYRNIQGAELKFLADASGNSRTRIAAGIAKGKFSSIIVAVKEGVQGPYRLRPPDNPELIFVVLAGSEKIWLDGKLLRRGFNLDYVIDYNTGEITLNNQLLITRYSRLRCDFEYAERNYSRSSILAEHEEKIGRIQLSIGHYQEQDNPYRPLGFTLDSANLAILRSAGDRPQDAGLSGITEVKKESRIAGNLYYTQRDTVIEGQSREYFLPAADSSSRIFQVTFTETLPGNGDYLLAENLGNGRRFRYAGPGKGNYRTGKTAVLPDLKSITRAGLVFDLGNGHSIQSEAVISRTDANRLSRENDADNSGSAQRISWRWQKPETPVRNFQQDAGITFTRLGSRFRGIDRFRDIEFERNWNGRSGDTLSAEDLLLESFFRSVKAGKWKFYGESNWRKKGENVSGFQQQLEAYRNYGKFDLDGSASLMVNGRSYGKALWQKASARFSWHPGAYRPFYQFQLDENEICNTENQVIASAMHFRSHSLGIESTDSARQRLRAVYTYREDKAPDSGLLKPFLYSHNAELSASFLPGGDHQLDLSGNYRLANPAGSSGLEENISARIDYSGSAGDGFLRQELVLTANTGQEARRSFQFIRINSIGEGSHQWIDYNGNGLQELDEFVEALRPEDRQYIKIFTPTRDFITAYTRSLNYRLHLSAPAAWSRGTGLRKLMSRLVFLSSVAEDQRVTAGNFSERYLPLPGKDGDNVLSASRILRNTLFFNRSSPDFGAEISQLHSFSKTLLSNGFARRQIREFRFLLRKNLSRSLNLSIRLLRLDQMLNSDVLASRNYRIMGWESGPELAWQPGTGHRFSLQVQVADKQNFGSEERALNRQAQFEYRAGMAGTRSINAGLRYNEIQFTGNAGAAVAYELLEGLLPGKNLTWTINVQQKLAGGLQLLFTYEGRKSENLRFIHLGKMQANLLF